MPLLRFYVFMFDERYTANCRIYNLLKNSSAHLSFHTPGHKKGKWDITELSFSDNLSSPTGILKEVQAELASLVGAAASFLLTDGSTCGVLSMLRASGCKKLLFPVCSHKSVYNGCKLLGIEPVLLPCRYFGAVPQQPSAEEIAHAVEAFHPDGVLLTSPDYYGNIADYEKVKAVCRRHGIPLLCDGAHGAHLFGTSLYAGKYCDLWVDGAHKSLPVFTQGALVSAAEGFEERLWESVDVFRTTSPSYPILASVEYGYKYPKNEKIVALSAALKRKFSAYENADWTKIVLCYGADAPAVGEYLEERGIFAEFCDGVNLMFYLSSATTEEELERLRACLRPLRPLQKEEATMSAGKGEQGTRSERAAWVPLAESAGRTCARNAGIFPPCIPILKEGEKIGDKEIARLLKAKNSYGLSEGKVLVYL